MGQICVKASSHRSASGELATEHTVVSSGQVQLQVAPKHAAENKGKQTVESVKPPSSAAAGDCNVTATVSVNSQGQSACDKDCSGLTTAGSAEHAQLRVLVDKLQQDNASLRAQIDNYQKKLGRPTQEMEQSTSSCQDCETWKLKYSHLKVVAEGLKHRISDLATGESGASHANTAATEQIEEMDPTYKLLKELSDANPDSKLPELWKGVDYRQWEGTRMTNGELTGLALPNMNISVLPKSIGKLTGLQTLILSENAISSLPSSIQNLKHLTTLLLDHNKLKQLPAAVCSLESLETLWLQDNGMKALPAELGKLKQLQRLLLTNNELVGLPDSVGDLSSLRSLWVDNNKLESLPTSMASLTAICKLRLEGNGLPPLSPELQALISSAKDAPSLISPARKSLPAVPGATPKPAAGAATQQAAAALR